MFERTRAITSALDFHRINIFDVAQAKRAAKWLKRRKTCGGVHSVFQSHWCIFSFIHHVKTTYYSSCTHEGLCHIHLPSSDIQTTPCALNFHANCLILCEKTAVSFKISIRAPRHERALLAPSPPFCFFFFFAALGRYMQMSLHVKFKWHVSSVGSCEVVMNTISLTLLMHK